MSNTYINAGMRREVIERAGNCCEYCRMSQLDQYFTFQVDHIIAEKHGGPTLMNNLCFACPECNLNKGSDVASVLWDGHDPTIIPLYNPRSQNWDDHFSYDPESGFLEGITQIAQATLRLLRWNEQERRIDRKLLSDNSRYPCAST